MGKYDVDFDDYEEKEGSGYDGEVPKKGTYTAKLVKFAEHTSSEGNDGLVWVFEITEGDYSGWRGWVYSNMDSTKWRTQQVTKAINGGKEVKTKLDPAEKESSPEAETNKTVSKAKPVRIRLSRETYDDEPRAKIRTVMPLEAGEGKDKKKKKKGDDPF